MQIYPNDQHIIDTPEQARLEFALAGIGSRFLAMAIDTAIQTGIAFALGVFGLLTGMSLGNAALSTWFFAALIFAFFLVYYGYFAVFEIVWNGQTPGKRAIGIRVIKDTGRPLTTGETLARNLLRIVDQLPAVYGVGLLVCVLNNRGKRLGDFVAGSILVRETAVQEIKPVWSLTATDTMTSPVSAHCLTVEELALVDAFLNRRSYLAADVRSKIALEIAQKLKDRRPPDFQGSAEALLEKLAYDSRRSG